MLDALRRLWRRFGRYLASSPPISLVRWLASFRLHGIEVAEPFGKARLPELSFSAIRHGDDLEQVAVRVVPVESPAAVVRVDPTFLPAVRVGPVGQAAFDDAGVDGVEVVIVDQERVVLPRGNPVVVCVVERDAVGCVDFEERTVRRGIGQAEDLAEERGRGLLVGAVDDRVIEGDAHVATVRRRTVDAAGAELAVQAVDDVRRVPARPVVVAMPEGALVLAVRVLGVTEQLGEGVGGQVGSHGSKVDDESCQQRPSDCNVAGW